MGTVDTGIIRRNETAIVDRFERSNLLPTATLPVSVSSMRTGTRSPFAQLILRFGKVDDAVLAEPLGDERPRTGFLVLAQVTLRSLQVHMFSGGDLCADLEERCGTCFLETRARPLEGPVQVLAL